MSASETVDLASGGGQALADELSRLLDVVSPGLGPAGRETVDRVVAELGDDLRVRLANELEQRTLLAQVPGIVYTLDAADPRLYRYISPQVETILGYTPAEVLAEPGFEYLRTHPEDLPALIEADRVAVATGEPFAAEYRIRAKDGRWVWLRNASVLVRDEDGTPRCWQGVAVDVTPEREARQALAASEQRFRNAFANAPVGMAVLTIDGNVVKANPALGAMLGRDPSELVGLTYRDFTHPDDIALTNDVMERFVAQGSGRVKFEKRYRRKDGETVWGRATVSLTVGPSGAYDHQIAQIEDISEEHRVREELRAERDLLQTVMDTLPVMIYVKDREGRYLRANRAVAEWVEADDPDTLIGKTDQDIHPPHLAATYAAREAALLASGDPIHNAIEPAVGPDGTPRWVMTSKVPLRDAEGRIVGLVGSSRDVTAIRETEAALAAERDLLQTVMNTIPDAVYVKDLENRFVRANPAEWAYHGLAAGDDLIGLSDADFYPPEEAAVFLEEEQAVMRTGVPIVNLIRPFDRGDNRRWFSDTKVPLRDPATGAVVGLLGISRNVTDLVEARERLEQALASEHATNEDLARAMAEREEALRAAEAANRELGALADARSRFIATVSHEFRTPLTAILGFSELLRDRDLAKPMAREFAADIHQSADRLERMITELLAMDVNRAAEFTLAPGPVDLNAQVNEVVAMLRPAAHGHTFGLALQPDLPTLQADADRIGQVLVNLVGNAVKYSPDGGTVRVETWAEGDRVRVAVGDQGIGIAPEHLHLVFEPYVRTDDAKAKQIVGTGLGLAIARQIVEAHGGRIWAESVLGEGSTFHLALPLTPPDADPA